MLNGCNRNHSSTIFIVKPQIIAHTLSYKSTVAPLEVINIQAPADSTIQKIYFQPGDVVQQNQLLLSLYSPKYISEYQNALITYLKAKEDYANAKVNFFGTEDLWKHGLIARDDYNTQKSSLASNYAMLLQQKQIMKAYLPPGTMLDESLSIENKTALDKLFNNLQNVVNIYSLTIGIALAPTKSESQNSGNGVASTLRLAPGTQVHQGDSLLTIGDLHGFNLISAVSEMDINKIQKNMRATVTSDAFPETLDGYVGEVGIEAKSSTGDVTLPEFPVRIVVPNVPASALKNIKIGMTAKVNIEIGSSQQILIPLSAVGNEKGQDVVRKITEFHKTELVPVTTGDTTLNQVTVLSGLKAGDRVLVPYSS
jgi:multidrug efflux pump subunit AcrA (membrane-fusion protein)